jgi:tricorn protease
MSGKEWVCCKYYSDPVVLSTKILPGHLMANPLPIGVTSQGSMKFTCSPPKKMRKPKKLTGRNKGFGYTLFWSPDSKKIAFVDERNVISIIDVASASVTEADRHLWNIGHGSRFGFPINWSPDSKFIAYTNDRENGNGAVFIYSLEDAKARQVTSGFYSDSNPVFSQDGKYLFYFTNRQLNAAYSDMGDGTWIYPNSTQLAVSALQRCGLFAQTQER